MKDVGATLPRRDALDERIIGEVRSGKTTFGKGIIKTQTDVGGWPELKSVPAPKDSDGDGMPDQWESSHGLDPQNSADGPMDRDGDGYTNVEEYLNGIADSVISSL